MMESSLCKFERIVQCYASHADAEIAHLVDQKDAGRLDILEAAIAAELPADVRALLERYDGESDGAAGVFIGHGLMSIEQIMDNVDYAQTLIKPEAPYVRNPTASQEILDRIAGEMLDHLNDAVRNGAIMPGWNRCEFECSPDSFGGAYLYAATATSDRGRVCMDCDRQRSDRIMALAGELHSLERRTYHWDALKLVIHGDGRYAVSRDFYDLTDEDNFTSFPEGAIRRTYFHLRWVPLIHDFGGNFIGVDLDPDSNGKTGQIIVFGRDENDIYVLANDWEGFLDLILDLIASRKHDILNCDHLHDFLQPIVTSAACTQHG
jgi:cell wall assembly regulator SMI1